MHNTIQRETFEGENVCEKNDYEDFAEKTFADSYYRPDMGCMCMRCL